jgi:hypothetical protein
VLAWTGASVGAPGGAFWAWVSPDAASQIAGTAFLLAAMRERNFALGLGYSKTEVVQVAIFGAAFLGDPLGAALAFSAVAVTLGMLLMSPADPTRPIRALVEGWTARASLLGIAAGTGFAFAAVGYRGAGVATITLTG